MLKAIIDNVEVQMRGKLAELRSTHSHSGIKGSGAEKTFFDFIEKYLSRTYAVGTGEIIDSYGQRSGQVDIVIANQDHPYTFTKNEPGLFFIEGVAAAGEIKSVLTTQELRKAIKNAIKFKTLKMQDPLGKTIIATPSDALRYGLNPPFFLFCYESQVSLENIHKIIMDYREKNKVKIYHTIDGIFILDKGILIHLGDGEGSFKGKDMHGNSGKGWLHSTTGSVLFYCLSFLSTSMPKIERPLPIILPYLYQDGNLHWDK
ncbi:DUF6602 domain-containing protein [Dyadobacter sp. CY351]|uniref:DUF6602 domain-containing protein n=1 Tax=Dyadobacter sp. CY351 TaxID=2909337 RepID=UPI001F4581BA|nr:DUF6602 domain-containing protein [Dyadobacter sp. CY351]MCF2520707.1 hypothetical protein [Dyadobacter sp. CY351]